MIYAAFLRGINVGGNKKVPMPELKKMMEKSGFTNVTTLLNSGNVLFDAEKGTVASLTKQIESAIEKTFGFQVSVVLRSISDLKKLLDSKPFKGIKVTPATRLYITFLSEKSKPTIKIPYVNEDKNFRILKATPTEVISVLTVTKEKGTVDVMKVLEKEWGKTITTRNWNTLEKMLK